MKGFKCQITKYIHIVKVYEQKKRDQNSFQYNVIKGVRICIITHVIAYILSISILIIIIFFNLFRGLKLFTLQLQPRQKDKFYSIPGYYRTLLLTRAFSYYSYYFILSKGLSV